MPSPALPDDVVVADRFYPLILHRLPCSAGAGGYRSLINHVAHGQPLISARGHVLGTNLESHCNLAPAAARLDGPPRPIYAAMPTDVFYSAQFSNRDRGSQRPQAAEATVIPATITDPEDSTKRILSDLYWRAGTAGGYSLHSSIPCISILFYAAKTPPIWCVRKSGLTLLAYNLLRGVMTGISEAEMAIQARQFERIRERCGL